MTITHPPTDLPRSVATEPGWPARLPAGPVTIAVLAKGGEGKTTSTASLGHALTRLTGWPVRLVDTDAQASLTNWLAPDLPADAGTLDDVLVGDATLEEVLRPLIEGMDLVPVANGLAAIEPSLQAQALTQRVIAATPFPTVVLLDTPATRPLGPGARVLRAALDAADIAVVPFRATAMSLDAVAETLAQIRAHEQLEHRSVPTLLLPTQVTRDGAEPLVSRALRLGGLTVLPPIPSSSWAGKAAADRVLIGDRAPLTAAIRTAYDQAAAALIAPIVRAAEEN